MGCSGGGWSYLAATVTHAFSENTALSRQWGGMYSLQQRNGTISENTATPAAGCTGPPDGDNCTFGNTANLGGEMYLGGSDGYKHLRGNGRLQRRWDVVSAPSSLAFTNTTIRGNSNSSYSELRRRSPIVRSAGT